ncbi:MAG: hypothetical protein HON90_05470 [Halobacteriovoraceae bacterium]|jgi:cardiolipin synthase A/B|nr:hypothetical protein [Halobacteriovoraceae bacterium]
MNSLTNKSDVTLLKNGKKFIELHQELIDQAKHFILLHTYIFKDDEVTSIIISSLANAAKRGVRVFIILDSYGSQDFSLQSQNFLTKNGVELSFFNKNFIFTSLGRRLHQKVLIIDNIKSIVGGINYAKEFNLPSQINPWLDYSCLIEGEEVHRILKKVYPLYRKAFQSKLKMITPFKDLIHYSQKSIIIKTNENNWMGYKQEIYKSYLSAIKSSKSEITILATYFIPGKKLLKYLRQASQRGVKVKLIFGAFSDQKIASLTSNYFYQWYLENQIEIYEWDESIMHGKLALIDSRWVTVGSYNHNFLSRYGNLELNIEVINNDFANIVQQEFEQIINNSNQITCSNISATVGNKFIIKMLYFTVNLITFLSLLFVYQRNETDDS